MSFLTDALDPANAQLRRGDTVLPLRPKTRAVLQYLAERSGRLVTKNGLLDAVWPDTAVTENGKRALARRVLTPVASAVTEGQDTVDVRAAHDLRSQIA